MLLGKIIAESAMREGKFVTWIPSYGAEVRGGTAHCMVIISDKEISSPYIEKADTLIIMNRPSLDKFKTRIKKNGLLILNSSLVMPADYRNAENVGYAFTDIAVKLGNIRIANMVALGYYISKKKIAGLKTVSQTIKGIAPADKKHLIPINLEAINQGAKLK